MKKINTHIHIIDKIKVFKIPALIKVDEFNKFVEIIITYNNIEYVGKGIDFMWVDAFASLQQYLPKGITLACCLTCKYGNMCPFGDTERKLLCTKKYKLRNKLEVAELYDNRKHYDVKEVFSDSYCSDYDAQSDDYYTYNDYRYKLHNIKD